MAKIVVYTMDGGASGMNGVGGAFSTDTSSGGAYPQKMAKMLQDYDPATWEWSPVDYQPYLALTEGHSLGRRVRVALSIVKQDLMTRPAGTKWILCGLSGGAVCASMIYNEARFGELTAWRKDLIGVITFGDPLRPRGWSIPWKGAIDPGGQGAGGGMLNHSFGPSGSLIRNPEWFYISFSQKGDSASSSMVEGDARTLVNFISEALINGDPNDPDMLEGFANGGFPSWLTATLDRAKATLFPNLGLLAWIPLAIAAAQLIWDWIGFAIGSIFYYSGDNTLAQFFNPHSQYDAPWAYNGLGGNNKKPALQLAYEWCLDVAQYHVNPGISPDTKINVYEAGGTNPLAPLYYPPEDLQKLPMFVGLDPSVFNYTLVQDYLNGIYPLNASIHQGCNAVAKLILRVPGKFVLVGTSQGAAIMSKIFQQMTVGSMQDRLSDCLGIFLFGNPLRQEGRAFPGATFIPTGHGIAPAEERLTNTTSLVWEFANQGDPVATNGSDAASVAREDAYEALQTRWNGLKSALSIATLVLDEIIAAFTPTPGDGTLQGMAVYHNEYWKTTWKPVDNDDRYAVQIVLDHLNQVAGPVYRTDGWSTVLSVPAS